MMVLQLSKGGASPWATAVVNVIGCLLIGLLGRWFESAEPMPPQWRLFLMVGLLGGFTTFSAFGYETHLLLRDRHLGLALLNVLGQVSLGLAAVWMGYQLGSRA
jgi:CrcB protein